MLERVLVLGGSGFIGRHFVAQLARREIKVTVPSRRRERAKHLILLPTVDVVQADVTDPVVLARLARNQDVVVNLVGILHGDFDRFHVELPRAVVGACRAAGVKRLLHLSALGADINGPSAYQRSKAAGEQVVLEARDLDATVLRPSVVFGPEDHFLNRFAAMARFLPVLAVPCPQARFQPVYVGDVARVLLSSIEDTASHGRALELGGPHEYALKQLVSLVCQMTGHRRLVLGLSPRLSYFQAAVLEHLPGRLMTRDNVLSMKVANVTAAPFPYGIAPQPLEAIAPGYLRPSGPHERYPQLRWRARR